MDVSFWDAEDGLMRGFLIREERFTADQTQEFFRHRLKRKDASRWQILRWMGIPQERSAELRALWRNVGPLAKLIHRELHNLPAEQAAFCWGLVVDGLVGADQMRLALRDHKLYAEEQLDVSLPQILVERGRLAPEAFVERVRAAGQVILQCTDCGGRSLLAEYDEQETYICDGCMGTLGPLLTIDAQVARMAHNAEMVALEPKEIIGEFEVGQPLLADPTGQLYRDAQYEGQLLKLLALEGQPDKEELRAFRLRLGELRKLDDPHLIVPLRLASDEERFFLVFEAPPGKPLVGHPDPPRDEDALAVVHALARALLPIHRVGLAHGSVRPANVWLPDDPALPACLIAAAEPLQPGLRTLPDDIFLPPGEAATPDQVSVRSDLHGLGVLLVWLLSGKLPAPGNPGPAIKLLKPGHQLIAGHCLLEESPYEKVRELLADLHRLLGDRAKLPTPSSPQSRRPSTIHDERRASSPRHARGSGTTRTARPARPPLLYLAIGLALATILVVAWFMSRDDARPAPPRRPAKREQPQPPKKQVVAPQKTPGPDRAARRKKLLDEAVGALELGQLDAAEQQIRQAVGAGDTEGLLWKEAFARLSWDSLVAVLDATAADRRWDRLGQRAGDALRAKDATRAADLAEQFWIGRGAHKDKPREAIPLYSKLLFLDPRNFKAYTNRGGCYRDLRQDEPALADYSSALRIKPGEPITLNNRALIWRDQLKYDEAIKDLSTALGNLQGSPMPKHILLMNRGVTYLLAGQARQALQDLDSIRHVKHAYIRLAILLAEAAQGHQTRSKAELEKLLAIRPGQIVSSLDPIRAHIKLCTLLVELMPDHPLPWAERASVHLQLGEKRKAAEDIQRALERAGAGTKHQQHRDVLQQMLARARG